MDRFEGFGKSTLLNPRLRNRWMYKDPVGRGKRLIIVDCITEDGPVPGALWTFSTQTTSKKVKKKMIFRQLKVLLLTKRPGKCKRFKNRMTIWKKIFRLQPQLRINGKKKSSNQLFGNKSKKDDEVEIGDKKHEEEVDILEDFDYHDNINAESYEKCFESVCKLLKPNSVIIIDNASYHSRNADDFPVSKWKNLSFKIG